MAVTVYQMIQELAKYPPDAEIMIECKMRIDGHAGAVTPEPNGEGVWVEDFEFDDLLTIESFGSDELYIDGTGDRECPRIKLTY